MAARMVRWRFRLLGGLEVSADDTPAPVRGPRLRAALVRLLIGANRTVSVPALVGELWPERPPDDAERTVRTYMSRLRSALPQLPLLTLDPGYRLVLADDALDTARFARLAASGGQALALRRWRSAHDRLTAALDLWAGEPYAGFDDLPAVAPARARLDRVRLDAVENRAEAALALGCELRYADELHELAQLHPAREHLWELLMIVLYRAGRQAEALAVFRRARTLLRDEFGIEPSPALAATHLRVLHQTLRLPPRALPELRRPLRRGHRA